MLRISRFINIFVDYIRQSHFCPKFETPKFIKILNSNFCLIQKFCILRENRDFLFITNRIIPFIELLSWSWSHSPNSLLCLDYVPKLLHLISFLLKHKMKEEHEKYKTGLYEYIYCCGLMKRIKQKFTSFKIDMDVQN